MKNLSVHMFTTSNCNLSCRHCFNRSGKDSLIKSQISGDNVIKYINDINDTYPNVNFEIEGGEIFLHNDFKIILKRIPCLSKCTITTNGTIPFNFKKIFIDKDIGEFLLRVSVEGHTQEIHSKIRNSSLKDVLTRAKKWQDEGVDVMLRATIHKYNHEHIEEMINHFISLGFKKIQLVEFQTSGRGEENREMTLTEDEMKKVINTLSNIDFDSKFQKLKLNISKDRKKLIEKIGLIELSSKNFIFKENDYFSLVVNWDESIACCPWNSFENILDKKKRFDFKNILPSLIQNGSLEHDCNHCSIGSLVWNKND